VCRLLCPTTSSSRPLSMSKFDVSHDYDHVDRVRRLSLRLARSLTVPVDLFAVELGPPLGSPFCLPHAIRCSGPLPRRQRRQICFRGRPCPTVGLLLPTCGSAGSGRPRAQDRRERIVLQGASENAEWRADRVACHLSRVALVGSAEPMCCADDEAQRPGCRQARCDGRHWDHALCSIQLRDGKCIRVGQPGSE
jgi:hypothetical protein